MSSRHPDHRLSRSRTVARASGFVRARTRSVADLPVSTIGLSEVEHYDPARLSPERPQRLDVVTQHTTLPFLLIRRTGAANVLVLNNGAVDHSRAQGKPVFQRSSWWPRIRHHQIYLCDPGTLGNDRLALAWGQVTRDHWVVPDAGRAVRALASVLGVADPVARVYFGSSAGGFMSLAMAALDPGAMAVVNNAQFDWTRWMPDSVNALRHKRFPGLLPAEIRDAYPARTNVLDLLVKSETPLRMRYMVNLGSKHDRLVDYPMLQKFQLEHPDRVSKLHIDAYFDRLAGHNPLPEAEILDIINRNPRD